MLRRNIKYCSFIMLFIGIVICLVDFCDRYYYKNMESNKINDFIDDNVVSVDDSLKEKISKNEEIKDSYIGVIEIPKIKLKRGFYDIDSIYNDVSIGIEVLKGVDMPDIKNGTFVLASHSGSGQVAYFKNLYKLSLGDFIYIYYDKKKYKYKIVDIYDIEKIGVLEFNKRSNVANLVLVTCSKDNEFMQSVYVSELVYGL